jgi:hypothetical protein
MTIAHVAGVPFEEWLAPLVRPAAVSPSSFEPQSVPWNDSTLGLPEARILHASDDAKSTTKPRALGDPDI